ncbi:MAG TPA: flagellar assembly protein FliW [Thermoanaerobacterales bacterium]|mgnify:CR=1 FL=1|jgi:flagellar assembly factor FliW|nr:flagellar assembly protein FliW [Thermoanaerobacterales bacterium]
MTIETRFGDREVDEEKVITFTNGILGLEQYKRYILLDHPGTDAIKWLQSVEEPEIALPVTNPSYFYPNYTPKISTENLLQLDIKSPEEAVVLCVITIPGDTKKITINLKAPIIINTAKRLADQLIAENPEYHIRQPMKLKKGSGDRRCESC